MEKSYWNSNGKYQNAVHALQALIPSSGQVTAKNSRALEKFRKASNCYYDLYNNGLCNRSVEFARTFKIAYTKYKVYGRIDFDAIMPVVEPIMDAIIEAAAKEQNIIWEGAK